MTSTSFERMRAAQSSRVWRSSLVRNVAATYVTQIARVAVGLATMIVISRALGPAGRGEYAVATALATLGAQFGTLGLHASNTYFSARQPQLLPGLLANSMALSLAAGMLAAIAAAVLFCLSPGVLGLRGPLLALIVLSTTVGLGYTLTQCLLLGVNRVAAYNTAEIAGKVIALVLVVVAVALQLRTPAAALAAGVAAQLIALLFALRQLLHGLRPPPRLSWLLFKDNFRYGFKAYLLALFCFLVLRIDQLMVQRIAGAEQAGYYAVAASMVDYMILLPTVIGTILFPRLAALASITEKLRLTRRSVLAAAGMMLPLLAAAMLLSSPLIRLLFGDAFAPAALAFAWLVPGIFWLGVHLVSVQFLNSMGYPWSVVVTWGACALLNLVLNFWAIPRYGIVGASAVSSISYFVAAVAVLGLIARYRSAHQAAALS